jgi:endoglycosylceramidase
MRATATVTILLLGGVACSDEKAGPIEPPTLPTWRLTVEDGRLVDALGREVLLRGLNGGSRAKFAPFFPFPFAESGLPDQAGEPPFQDAGRTYVERIASWGLDVVRLTFSWEALEPVRGTYDGVYLERYAALAEGLGQRGIRVIVDFHQDVFARPFCGDGFPLWTLPDPGMTPRIDCSRWFTGYLGDAEVDAAFDRFWAGEDGLRDSFEAMWRHVAARLWPVQGVIGFDVLNEPHSGTAERDAWSVDVLRPFFERMAVVVREEAPDALLFFEPAGLDGSARTTALELPAGGGFVFAPHYYATSVFLLGPDAATYDTDADLAAWAERVAGWGVPLLLGEFGSKTGTDGGARYLRANFDSLDRYLFHGTAWEYSTAYDDWNAEGYSVTRYGGEETPSVAALVRAYPRAVAGRITSFAFDADTRRGTLSFAAAPGVTEIAAPARLYPEGVQGELAGASGRTTWDAEHGLLLVETTGAGAATISFGPDLGR